MHALHLFLNSLVSSLQRSFSLETTHISWLEQHSALQPDEHTSIDWTETEILRASARVEVHSVFCVARSAVSDVKLWLLTSNLQTSGANKKFTAKWHFVTWDIYLDIKLKSAFTCFCQGFSTISSPEKKTSVLAMTVVFRKPDLEPRNVSSRPIRGQVITLDQSEARSQPETIILYFMTS